MPEAQALWSSSTVLAQETTAGSIGSILLGWGCSHANCANDVSDWPPLRGQQVDLSQLRDDLFRLVLSLCIRELFQELEAYSSERIIQGKRPSTRSAMPAGHLAPISAPRRFSGGSSRGSALSPANWPTGRRVLLYASLARGSAMKHLVTASLACMALALPAVADTIRVGMSGGYFPFTFVRQDQLQGFEVDFMNAIAAETGDTAEFSTMAFSGLIGALEAGRLDTVANQITITAEREAKFVFTQPYVYDGAQVVVREGNDDIKGVEDLRGKTVAVNLGSNFEQLLRELPFADEIDIRTYDSNIEQDTALGRVDAFVMDRVSSAQVIAESPLPLELAGPPFSEIQNALPFRNDEAGRALRDRVDAAITTLKENGTLKEISEKWLGADVTVPAS